MIRVAVYMLLALGVAASLTGCDPQSRHRALTFFFTGVPPLEEEKPVKKSNDQLPSPAAEVLPQPAAKGAGALFSHPVWVAGICAPCHESTGVFRTPGVKKTAATAFTTGGGKPGRLTLAKKEICTQCHKDKTPQRAANDNLWLHDTAAKGECLACHDPHQSNYARNLLQPPSIICLPCHQKGAFLTTPAHRRGETCLSCHNPHIGINKNLLTAEYKEIKIPVPLDLADPAAGR